ncbi:MAG: SusD/RagB family nutrient-binding outer membrane lipoprotein [Chitinophagaceae bacterium]
MKYKKIIYSLLLTAFMIGADSCSKKKFDINSNPDDVTDNSVTASVLLPGAQQATSTTIASEFWFLSWWMGQGARSGSYQSFTEEETYAFTNDFHVAVWNQLYSNATNYNLIINKAAEAGSGIYEAIGRIMKSHNFVLLADIYGNVPYSEAFQGTVVATPKYDNAVDVYKGCLADLDLAIERLHDDDATAGAVNPDIESADLIYGGDIESWLKFANTLRLRMLVHLANGISSTTFASDINIGAEVAKFTAEGFIGEGESAMLNPGFSGSKPNPYYRAFNTNESGSASQRDWARANEYAIEYYKYNGDPRINRFYVAPGATQVGIEYGTPSGPAAPIGSALSTVRGPGLTPDGAASDAWIFTSVESLFLQAEARQRGILTTGPTAEELTNAAITESFVWLGLTEAQATTFISNNATYPDVDINAPGGGLFTIISQKWFALNSIAPYELWTDYRRTDIVLGEAVGFAAGPPLSVDPGNKAPNIPVRLFYPQNEFNYNAANVAAQGNINVFTTKIFWDLN